MDSLNFYKPPTHFVVVKTVSPNFHKIATCLTGVKTDSLSSSCLLHTLRRSKLSPVRFAWVKSASYMLCGSQNKATAGLLIIFWDVKWTLRASAGLLHTLQGSKRTFRVSACLLDALQESNRTLKDTVGLLNALRGSKQTLQASTGHLQGQNCLLHALQGSVT